MSVPNLFKILLETNFFSKANTFSLSLFLSTWSVQCHSFSCSPQQTVPGGLMLEVFPYRVLQLWRTLFYRVSIFSVIVVATRKYFNYSYKKLPDAYNSLESFGGFYMQKATCSPHVDKNFQ